MSKEAALRAMREARYNERMGLSAKAPARAAKRPRRSLRDGEHGQGHARQRLGGG